MSKDYKIGIVVGLLILVVGVTYYSVTGRKDQPTEPQAVQEEQADNQTIVDAGPADMPAGPIEVASPVDAGGGPEEAAKEWGKKWNMPKDQPGEKTATKADDAARAVVKLSPVTRQDDAQAQVKVLPAKTPAEPGRGETSYASEKQGSGDTDGSYFKLDSDAPAAMAEEAPPAAPVSYQPQRVVYRGKDTYVVQPNDSLYKIAEKVYGPAMGSKWRLIRQANPDVDPATLSVGTKLRIPPLPADKPAPPATPKPVGLTSTATGQRTYIVSKGDRAGLWGIAKKVYGQGKGYQYVLIQKANPKIDPRRLRAGMKLIIPPLPAATAPSGTGTSVYRSGTQASSGRRTYVVKRNDTIWGIAQIMYGDGKYAKLIIDANPKIDPSRLKPGQKLTLPPSPKPRPATTRKKPRPARPARPTAPPPGPGEPDFGP